jgi:prepilin-type N-terminal cleavage/methylation domain-containing protein
MRFNKQGFTLIELLIVIALLGALAVGLLAALDPFEQLKKGTDTGIRNTTVEMHGAIIRFYAIKNYMPWCTDASTCADPTGETLTTMNTAPFNTAIDAIIDTGELKEDFIALAGAQMDLVYMTGTNDPAEAVVCFRPQSKSMINDPNTKYEDDGTEVSAAPLCKTEGGTREDCYWCVR